MSESLTPMEFLITIVSVLAFLAFMVIVIFGGLFATIDSITGFGVLDDIIRFFFKKKSS